MASYRKNLRWVAATLALVSIAASAAVHAETSHRKINPVFRQLIEAGVAANNQTHKLPPPTLPDGISVAEQRQKVESLGGSRYPFEKLTRKSIVAPQIVRVPTRPVAGGDAPLRTVDLWFVVHADLDAVADPTFLGKILNTQEGDGQAFALTAAQLADRGIEILPQNEDSEGFGHVAYDLLDRVRIEATGRSFYSRSDESIVGAVVVDRRFEGDAEFPNQWRPLERVRGGYDAGPPTVYGGLGFYVKITRIEQPEGALLVEFHMAFAEPADWFRGTNQLGAKLPAVLQSQVRTARREMMTVSR